MYKLAFILLRVLYTIITDLSLFHYILMHKVKIDSRYLWELAEGEYWFQRQPICQKQ